MGRSKPWIGHMHAVKRLGKKLLPGETAGDSYVKRGIALLELGFLSYADYLESELWASIRASAYQLHGRLCLICKAPANCIHHLDYTLATLKGFSMNSLIPICDPCHKRVEFDSERKRPMHEVRAMTLSLLPRKPAARQQQGRRCIACGNLLSPKKTRGRRKTLCKRCCYDRGLD